MLHLGDIKFVGEGCRRKLGVEILCVKETTPLASIFCLHFQFQFYFFANSIS
jgi:hypothetical protein